MRIEEQFEAFNSLNILIVGDVMIDRYWTGKVERISPEAPVPVVALEQSESRLGGAANVALNVKALGATPYLCSVIGKDAVGKKLLSLLPKNKISNKQFVVSDTRRTTVKTRILANNQQMLRVDEEDIEDLSEQEANELLRLIRELLDQREIHLILFQDYNKGVLSEYIIREVILESLRRDIPTAVDPKFNNFWSYKRVSLFKPNLKEIGRQLPFDLGTDKAGLTKATQYINDKLGNRITLITLSDKGLYIDDKQKTDALLPTKIRAIADVCGAGDAVISVAALGLALKMDINTIAQLANIAGGQVCERVGVVAVDKVQLLDEFKSTPSVASPKLQKG